MRRQNLAEIEPVGRAATRGPQSDFGRVLILAGSKGIMAPHLAGMGALRAGAGLVRLAVPEAIYTVTARREQKSWFTRPLDTSGNS
jgi:NAD(P)H-hydrate repair Nnr-like enzyme with NAD(P)H-hydrate dehydratase domain